MMTLSGEQDRKAYRKTLSSPYMQSLFKPLSPSEALPSARLLGSLISFLLPFILTCVIILRSYINVNTLVIELQPGVLFTSKYRRDGLYESLRSELMCAYIFEIKTLLTFLWAEKTSLK